MCIRDSFKTKSRAHPTSPAQGPKRIVPVFGPIKLRYIRVRLLCLTFNRSSSFFSQSEALHGSALCPPYECRRTERPPTYVSAYTPPPRHIYRYYIRIPTCTMATDGSASAASEIEVDSIYPTMRTRQARSILGWRSFAPPRRSRQIRVLLVWRGVGCGGCRASLRTSAFV